MALARKTDPATSHQAAQQIERNGRAAKQRDACLLWVNQRPGSTAAEIAALAELERHVPSRRLPELRDAGLVVNGPARECSVQHTKAMTWLPVDKKRQARMW
jgi:hypothetical protein